MSSTRMNMVTSNLPAFRVVTSNIYKEQKVTVIYIISKITLCYISHQNDNLHISFYFGIQCDESVSYFHIFHIYRNTDQTVLFPHFLSYMYGYEITNHQKTCMLQPFLVALLSTTGTGSHNLEQYLVGMACRETIHHCVHQVDKIHNLYDIFSLLE